MSIRILKGSCLETLSKIEDQSINTCITSPPYWGLRDYGTAEWKGGDENCDHLEKISGMSDKNTLGPNKHLPNTNQANISGKIQYKNVCAKCGAIRKDSQLGLEETPEEFVENLVKVFREVKRVLRDDGTVWLNLGDTYSSHKDCKSTAQTLAKGNKSEVAHVIDKGKSVSRNTKKLKEAGLKNKDLVGIPWRVAFALQADGWYLRQDIIWYKLNPMPESVRDRCTKAHEYIFLLSKKPKYYYDHEAIKEDCKNTKEQQLKKKNKSYRANAKKQEEKYLKQNFAKDKYKNKVYAKKNKRSVWTVTTKPFKDAHFATFPTELIEPCVLAGCPEGGVVLDPFGGSGTTALVANQYNRSAVLCELNEKYIEIAEKRLKGSFTMFTSTTLTIE